MKIVIHQPEFVPPVPFFKRLMAADKYVVLAHGSLDPKGAVTGFAYGGQRWGMRVDDSLRPLVDRVYTHCDEDWQAIVKAVGHGVLQEMTPLIRSSVLLTNLGVIEHLCKRLGVTTPIVLDEPMPLRGTDRLIQICRQHKADTFVAIDGIYMDAAQFKAARINVEVYLPEDRDNRHVCDIL